MENEKNPQFTKIREYIAIIISYWQRTNSSDPLFKNLREARETDTLEAYNNLVRDLYLGLHFLEGDELNKLVEKAEKNQPIKNEQ